MPAVIALLSALLLIVVGGAAAAGIVWLVQTVPPSTPLAEPVLFLFVFVAVSCLVALGAWIVVRPRDQDGRRRSAVAFLGHAMLFAAVSLFALWLQSLRMLSPLNVLLLSGLYVCLDLALIFGTRGAVEVRLPAPNANRIQP